MAMYGGSDAAGTSPTASPCSCYPTHGSTSPIQTLTANSCGASPCLKAMLAACKGEHSTVGIMWDWLSLPQPPRSDEEDAVFSRGLRKMNAWYMHPFTHVLLLSCPLPTGAAYTNTKAFDARGWCYFEACASSLVKHDSCLWSYANFPPVSTMPIIVPAGAPAPSTSTDDDGTIIVDVTDDNEALLAARSPQSTRSSLPKAQMARARSTACGVHCVPGEGAAEPE